LIFHVQEHRFTLPQLADMVAEARLKIERIEAPENARRQFAARFPTADMDRDIACWAEIESQNPGLLGPVYCFTLAQDESAAIPPGNWRPGARLNSPWG
jgi:hypothetical protein